MSETTFDTGMTGILERYGSGMTAVPRSRPAQPGLSAGAAGGAAAVLDAPDDDGDGGAGVAFGFAALVGALGANTAALRTAEHRRARMAAAVRAMPMPVFAFTGAQLTAGFVQPAQNWGPRRGVNWAIQTLTVAGLGTSDYATVYRANSTADLVPGNGRYTLTVTVAGAVATWHPGRTGLVLLGRDAPVLGFAGSSSSAEITIGGEIIQVDDDQLPYFLL